jgi:ATP-dependent RNA helicase DDX19/DBP5
MPIDSMRGLSGRTGRFGRKGISINFVHDKNTWAQMEAIEKSTGKAIIRIETTDLDVMEEVRTSYLVSNLGGTHTNV